MQKQSAMEKRTVISGICFLKGELVCGVPEKQSWCDEGSWLPPHVVADSGHEHRTCAYYPDTVTTGRCGPNSDGSPGMCSNLSERCDDPAAYVPRDQHCTLTQDSYFPEGEEINEYVSVGNMFGQIYTNGVPGKPWKAWTTYGACVSTTDSRRRCVWSPRDCAEGVEEYTKNDMECTSDKVDLGACFDGYSYCTVSPATCENPDGSVEPYYTHQEMNDKFKADCILAPLPSKRYKNPPTAAPSVRSMSAPTSSPTLDISIDGAASEDVIALSATDDDDSGGLSSGALAGIVVAMAILVGLTIGLVSYRMGYKTVQAKKKKKRKAPMRQLSSPNSNGMDDDVSELGDDDDVF